MLLITRITLRNFFFSLFPRFLPVFSSSRILALEFLLAAGGFSFKNCREEWERERERERETERETERKQLLFRQKRERDRKSERARATQWRLVH